MVLLPYLLWIYIILCSSSLFSIIDATATSRSASFILHNHHVRPTRRSTLLSLRSSSSNNNYEKKDKDEIMIRQIRRREILAKALTMTTAINAMAVTTEAFFALAADTDIGTNENSSFVSSTACNDGSIETESAVPGAYQSICMNMEERSVVLKSTKNKENLTILQGGAASSSNTQSNSGTVTGRTGVTIWNSCLLLVRLIDTLAGIQTQQHDNASNAALDFFGGKQIVELGCGTGLSSMAVSILGSPKLPVLATDGNEEVINLAKINIERNFNNNNEKERVKAIQMQWGFVESMDLDGMADIIIGSDLTYNPNTWRSLCESIDVILKPGGYFLYLTLGHSGFNVNSEMSGFEAVLLQNKRIVKLVDDEGKQSSCNNNNEMITCWPFEQGKVKSLTGLLLSSLTEKEKRVVVDTGGVKVMLFQKKKNNRS